MTRPGDEARDNTAPDPQQPDNAKSAEQLADDKFLAEFAETFEVGAADEDSADIAFMAEFMETFDEHGQPVHTPGDDEELPDVGFTLVEDQPTVDPAERAKELTHQIARELAVLGPEGWTRLDAQFVMTTAAELAQASYFDNDQRAVRTQPTAEILALVREQRHVSAELSDGPWWRLLLTLTSRGEIEVDYDYGDEPFPDDQLFPPEAYLADIDVYQRDRLPVWLAGYIGHADRQSRPAHEAAVQARADREKGVRGEVSLNDFPEFPVMWARWAVMAAGFVAARSQWGPRILPALGFFEGAKRSGSTLYLLPGGRAVLSGGVWNSPELDATYNDGTPMPKFYAGAPEWVANPVLNPRAANGLLSFCYWWEGGRWHRGASPTSDLLAPAVPGMWTTETVVDVVSGLAGPEPTERQRSAVATLVAAAEVGVVTRNTLVDVFGEEGFDIDSAFYQLTMAGVTLTQPQPMPQEDAIARVRQFILGSGVDTTGYPVEDLRADRISVGWMVYVPTRPGEISIGRALFYIADDGVLEQSSSSVAPAVFIAEFEQRFQRRHGTVEA